MRANVYAQLTPRPDGMREAAHNDIHASLTGSDLAPTAYAVLTPTLRGAYEGKLENDQVVNVGNRKSHEI